MFIAAEGEPSDSPDVRACKALIAAVVLRGLDDVRRRTRDKNRGMNRAAEKNKRDALRWFRSNRKDVWSFRWMCDVLGVDEGVIKKYLEEYY